MVKPQQLLHIYAATHTNRVFHDGVLALCVILTTYSHYRLYNAEAMCSNITIFII
jgi:hypothetical protein